MLLHPTSPHLFPVRFQDSDQQNRCTHLEVSLSHTGRYLGKEAAGWCAVPFSSRSLLNSKGPPINPSLLCPFWIAWCSRVDLLASGEAVSTKAGAMTGRLRLLRYKMGEFIMCELTSSLSSSSSSSSSSTMAILATFKPLFFYNCTIVGTDIFPLPVETSSSTEAISRAWIQLSVFKFVACQRIYWSVTTTQTQSFTWWRDAANHPSPTLQHRIVCLSRPVDKSIWAALGHGNRDKLNLTVTQLRRLIPTLLRLEF